MPRYPGWLMRAFGCNPGGRACQQALRAKRLLTMRALGCNPGRRACQQALRAKRLLTMRVFGCNPGGRACQQALRAKHLLTMRAFGCNPSGRACQQALRAKRLLTMRVSTGKNPSAATLCLGNNRCFSTILATSNPGIPGLCIHTLGAIARSTLVNRCLARGTCGHCLVFNFLATGNPGA